MDSLATYIGVRIRTKPDLDVLAYERQIGEWSIKAEESFMKHLAKLAEGFSEPLWYGRYKK